MDERQKRKGRPASARVGGVGRAVIVIAGLLAAALLQAATVVVNNLDAGSGTGFDDPTPVAPVAGNPATTLGAQRLAAFQAAAEDWGATLVSAVTITVDAEMSALPCTQNSAVVGSAGPNGFIFRDFPGAPVPATWFPQALHNAIRGFDGDAARADVGAEFNQNIGQPGCLQALSWSYVIGAPAPGGTIPFTETVLHEIAHGLGFLTFVDLQTGQLFAGYSDQYTRYLLDETPPTLWTALSNAGRANSAKDNGNLTWTGPNVANVAGLLTSGRHGTSGRVRLYAPSSLQLGSSVSHWDTALSPNEIMEPNLQSTTQRRLSNHLMLDIGWSGLVALAVTKTDGQASTTAGSPIDYTIAITNSGPADVSVVNATVVDNMPAALSGLSWTCNGSGGASCSLANGVGSINTTVTVPRNGVVTFQVAATIDAGFSGNLSNTVTVTLPAGFHNTVPSSATDNTNVIAGQPAGITVSAISGNTTEGGGTATFTMVLGSEPTANVTIGLSSDDLTEGTVLPTSVTFMPGNWDTPQVVTVTGEDDDLVDGDIDYAIVTAPATSGDDDYDGLNPNDVSVTNLDDDDEDDMLLSDGFE